MKKAKQIITKFIVIALALILASCGAPVNEGAANPYQSALQSANDTDYNKDANQQGDNQPQKGDEIVDLLNNDQSANGNTQGVTNLSNKPVSEYNKGVVLVKVKETFNKADLGTVEYISAQPLYTDSKWYTVQLADEDATEDAVEYLSQLNTFDKVDYDFIMGVTGPKEDAKENPNYDDQVNLGLSNIPNGWTQNGKAPGGSPDVVVAVIDTGVDYNHIDLRNNIWVNAAEIPDNGKDDDGNGYVDDIYGWDCVGNDKDPMDDNGHGTHVAGIIAAENNKDGGIGVAYNCKVMVLKAGNSSGYFNNSDIAEAIEYAYMNGASVINMSFGGSSISLAVEDALQSAYNSCVLVAAAGNDGACNDLKCATCLYKAVSYPAALPYVIGVMSTQKDGKHISSFSNYDHNPYDSIEYEVYAVGEGVGSTWPSNKYACLNGTSMAAPTVSGIAALLRSYYPDRETYSTKFIQSQIVNTGTVHPHILGHVEDTAHAVADVQEAMTKIPTPAVNLYDRYIDDSTSISAANNGNGVIDAGETVRLYVSLHNRGGVATNVNVTIDADRGMGLTDPYFTFANTSIQLSDIGTYSVRESEEYFEIVVSGDCPNSYYSVLNLHITFNNGLDEDDKTVYTKDAAILCNVNRGYHLSGTISEDTVFEADRLYIVSSDVVIPADVTVTFKEGCQIQFYDNREYYNSPRIVVYGTLNFEGTKDNMVKIAPDEHHFEYLCPISNLGSITFSYTSAVNLFIKQDVYIDAQNEPSNAHMVDSYFMTEKTNIGTLKWYNNGKAVVKSYFFSVDVVERCCLAFDQTSANVRTNEIVDSIVVGAAELLDIGIRKNASGNIFVSRKNTTRSSSTASSYTFGYTYMLASVKNNVFCSSEDSIEAIISLKNNLNVGAGAEYEGNSFSKAYQQYASQVIKDYYDASGNPIVDVYGSLSDPSVLWPYVVSVEMFDKDGKAITTVGKEEIKVRVTFNRAMDTTKDTYLTFGTIEPYADYRINGTWVSDTVWEGTYTLKAQIENGQNFLKVNNACAAEDQTKVVLGEYQLHEFTIDTTAAMAMNLMAFPQDDGIRLDFAQDDYDTLLGYNIYRAESKDGNYVKLNPTILLADENSFLDENAEPGKTYWYTYTVVLSDFSESAPAGKVVATAKDTMSPTLYHTPVNQGYENNNLVITATATDNVAISRVILYYRTVGADQWKSLVMSKQNDKFSATVFGSEVTLEGIEYYIVAEDANNSVQKGSADAPYTVIVKSADSLLGIGDVDGNGSVTTKDALMLMQCLNGDLILTDDQFKRADLNADGKLSSSEALRILQYVNGKVTTLKM